MMHILELYGRMQIPENSEEIRKESELNRHERYLRIMIAHGLPGIYVGDTVLVSNRWNGENSKNPHEGRSGIVQSIESYLKAPHDASYLNYFIKTEEGEVFQTFYYTLDRVKQAEGNTLLEKALRETNEAISKWFDSRKASSA